MLFHAKTFYDPILPWSPWSSAHCLFIGFLMTAHWCFICFLCGMKFIGWYGQRGHSQLQYKHEGAKLMGKFHCAFQSQTLSSSTGLGVLLLGGFLSLFCPAHHWLAACHPDLSQEPSPHNHSSCWIIQSKQWPTFEVGNKLERRRGVDSGTEADWGRSWGTSGGGGNVDGRVKVLVCVRI